VSTDDNGIPDIYAVDVPTGALRLVTRDADGNSGNGASDLTAASLSANGRWLVYETRATNLADGDGNGTDSDVVVVDPRK
jgi:Tol biopolymer transport system component